MGQAFRALQGLGPDCRGLPRFPRKACRRYPLRLSQEASAETSGFGISVSSQGLRILDMKVLELRAQG